MSQEQVIKRRAVYTGLKPFMDTAPLLEVIDYWEANYADSPRFTLQRFVADICNQHNLREQRSDILLSLVQSMNMPVSQLLPDPVNGQAGKDRSTNSTSEAFCLLMSTLLDCLPASNRHSVRLDLYASVDQRKLPPALASGLQAWLGNDKPLRIGTAAAPILRAIVNRAYVVICERLGPVEADRLLADASRRSRSANPALDAEIANLL